LTKIGVKSNLAYCASKAAVGAITRCLAVEWAAQGIRVVNVAPGYIDTELNREALQGPLGDYLDKRIPRKTPGTAQEVAALVAAMTREDMSFVTGETYLYRRRPSHCPLTKAMTIFQQLDDSIDLNEDERQLLESVRSLAEKQIKPSAAAYDLSGAFPWDNIRAINQLGLNAMFIPDQYGGAQLSYTSYLACVREISKACASTGIIWATKFSCDQATD